MLSGSRLVISCLGIGFAVRYSQSLALISDVFSLGARRPVALLRSAGGRGQRMKNAVFYKFIWYLLFGKIVSEKVRSVRVQDRSSVYPEE